VQPQPLTPAERQIIIDYYPLILSVARKLAPEWFDEAVSLAVTGAIKGLRSWRTDGGQPLDKWIAQHANYEIRRQIDKGKAPITATPEIPPGLDAAAPDDRGLLEHRDEIEWMHDRINKLPEPLRMTLNNFLDLDGSVEKVAKRQGWPVWRVRDTLSRARRLLGVDPPIVAVLGPNETLEEAAKARGLDLSLVVGRMRAGWSLAEALEGERNDVPAKRPKQVKPRITVSWEGEQIPLAEAIRRSGLADTTVRERIKSGWSPEDAIHTPPGGKRSAAA